MTKDNYTQMSNEELLNIIQQINVCNRRLKIYLSCHNSSLYNEIVLRTHFLDEYYGMDSVPILARLFCLKHNLSAQPVCKNPKCKNHNPCVKWMNGENRFRDYCCLTCANTDPIHQQKMQETMNKQYGVCHALQSKIFMEKCISTCRKNNGVDFPSQSSEVREKIRKTNLENLGVDNPLKSKEVKQKLGRTNNIVYGVDYVLQSDAIKEKIRKSINSLYGVDNYSQTMEFHRKCRKRYTDPKYPEMSFTNSWEFKVYDFLTEHNIPFEYQIEPIPYEYDNGIHYYHPDFSVNGRIYEVKGEQFFKVDETTNKEIMCVPNRKSYTEEEYVWRCGKEEAKHQCMIEHNVVILRHSQIKNLTIDMFK